MSLVGKVIRNDSQAFLVLKELDLAYIGYWVNHPRMTNLTEVLKAKAEESSVLANSLEEYIAKGAIKKADVEARRMYVNKVCHGENSVLGIVTSYEDGMCHGLTPAGDEWHCQHPVIVGTDLCDYVKKGIEKKVQAAV
jgi:hypothetical protein